MTTQHTPEPWLPMPGRPETMSHIQTASGEHIATFSRREDMDRTIACVRMCAGISTEELEQEPAPYLAAAVKQVTEQRDELAGALRSSVDQMDQCERMFKDDAEFIEALAQARAVLAKLP